MVSRRILAIYFEISIPDVRRGSKVPEPSSLAVGTVFQWSSFASFSKQARPAATEQIATKFFIPSGPDSEISNFPSDNSFRKAVSTRNYTYSLRTIERIVRNDQQISFF